MGQIYFVLHKFRFQQDCKSSVILSLLKRKMVDSWNLRSIFRWKAFSINYIWDLNVFLFKLTPLGIIQDLCQFSVLCHHLFWNLITSIQLSFSNKINKWKGASISFIYLLSSVWIKMESSRGKKITSSFYPCICTMMTFNFKFYFGSVSVSFHIQGNCLMS